MTTQTFPRTVASARAPTLNRASSMAGVMAGAMARAMAGAMAGAMARAMAGAMAGAMARVMAVAMTVAGALASTLIALATAGVATLASAQGPVPGTVATTAASAAATAPVALPFGVGERAVYRVSYNIVGRVGTGTMQIVGIDTVRGSPAFHALFTLKGRFLFARVDNRFESWLDVRDVFSHRFEQKTHEINFRRNRIREFYPAELRWTGHTNDRPEQGTLGTTMPLDDTAFLYFVRTLDLEVGREYSFDRYWNQEGNPVRVRVLRRETVTVPAGTFDTLVLQPLIRTSGLFSEGGEAEVYFAETGARQLVMLRAKVSFGTLQLQLEEFTPADLAPVVRND
jgi:hypothetical protein